MLKFSAVRCTHEGEGFGTSCMLTSLSFPTNLIYVMNGKREWEGGGRIGGADGCSLCDADKYIKLLISFICLLITASFHYNRKEHWIFSPLWYPDRQVINS